jgi:hypothetical protein
MEGKQASTGPWYYLPIVLTTANLLLTEFDESEIGLRTGQLPISKASTKSVDWVVLTFPVRGSLQVTKPTHSAYYPCGPSDDFRLRFKVKSVAIVWGEKVLDFLPCALNYSLSAIQSTQDYANNYAEYSYTHTYADQNLVALR